ncbi:MAG TPA: DUF3618 domain-containing protein [Jatrophihabitans sp.]|jgi:phage-related tail fiber protein
MSEPEHSSEDEAEVVRQEIAQTRAELAETVDALSDKLDVKQQAADKVAETKAKVGEAATKAKQAAPEPVQRALDTAVTKAAPVASQVSAKAAPHRGKIIAGALAAVAVLIVARRKRSDR